MENKFAIVITETKVAEKLQKDLLTIGFSQCSVFSSIDNVLIAESQITPELVLAEVLEANEKDFLALETRIQKYYGSTPILFISEEKIAKDFVKRRLLKNSDYITYSYTLRELELCTEVLLDQRKQVKTSHLWFNHSELLTLFNVLPNGIIISDDQGRIINVNKALSKILGYTFEEFCSMNIWDLTLQTDRDLIHENINRILNGETIRSEVINVCKNGERKNLEIIDTRISLPDGKYGLLIISSDITHLKEMNSALKESEEKYRVLVEKSNDGIVFAQNGILVYGNPMIMNMIGVTSSDFIGQPFHKYLHASELDSVMERYKRRQDGDVVPEIYETIIQRLNGESVPVEFNVNMAYYRGKPTTMVFIRDISKRKLTEKFLKESEESYRSIFDNASEAIYIQDSNGVFIDVNKAALQLYGYSKSEIIGETPEKLSAPGKNELSETAKYLSEAFKGKTQTFEFWGLSKEGRVFPKEVILNKGKYFGVDVVIAMARDISDRKNAEAILVESEEKFRTLTEQIPVGIYRTSESGKFFYANPALAHILGYASADELLIHNVNEFFARPEDRFHVIKSVRKSKGYTQSEFKLVRKDGKQIWIRDNSKSNFDSYGNLLFFDGVVENITAQKEAIEALKKSEANLRATLNAIPDLMFRFSREGIYLDSHAYNKEELFIDPSKLLGKSIFDFFPAELCNNFIGNISKCLEKGELQTFDYSVTIKGNLIHFESRMIPIGPNEVLSFSRNITDKKKAEENIKMLAQTIMNISECVSITDIGDNLIYVNPALLKTYGYEEEEVIGKNISILRSPSITEAQGDEIFTNTLKGGWQGEVLNIRKDGREFPISLSTAVVYDDNGEPVAFVGVASDITDRKIAQQDLIKAKERAEESDKLKTAFLANMSHEIRSPMNAILGFIRIIKEEEKLSENGKQYIELISNSGEQLVSVIEDILDTSKIQANQLRLSIREFDLNALLTDLYTIYNTQVKEKHKTNTVMLPPVLPNPSPFLIHSDDMRIRQIITNLLSNAIKFTSVGMIEFGYSVFIDDTNPSIQFFVKDTGIGLAPDALDLIFERFRQADDSYTRMYGGSGLGLAISKGLIELLGGKIWVESKEGEGSTFYFTLPLDKILSSGKEKLVDDGVNESITRIEGLNWSDKTILVVEDMQDIQYFLKRIFIKTDVNLLFAATIKEARAIFKSTRNIDLILLDIRLPDGDGYDLSVEFKAQKPKIPIIAQTAYAMHGEKEKSVSFGCDDFITKPINSDILFLKIDSLLKRLN